MKFVYVLLVFFMSINFVSSQNSEDFGFKHYQINDSILGDINYYVTLNGLEKQKPLLLLVDGSSALPVFGLLIKKDGSKSVTSKIALNTQKLSQDYHVAIISKPGIPFIDSLHVETSRQFKKTYKTPLEYSKKLSHDWRVNSADLVINHLVKNLSILDNEIIAVGYSEGGQVVPKLALVNKKITKIVNIVGGGLNQFYDLIIDQRIKANKGEISYMQSQKNIDSLYVEFESIYKDSKSTEKQFWGDTYLRWSSFCLNIPMEDMLQLDIPILMITAAKDRNAEVLGFDYVKLEFLRLGKTNLTYKIYPNCDHYFYDDVENKDRIDEMGAYMLKWIDGN